MRPLAAPLRARACPYGSARRPSSATRPCRSDLHAPPSSAPRRGLHRFGQRRSQRSCAGLRAPCRVSTGRARLRSSGMLPRSCVPRFLQRRLVQSETSRYSTVGHREPLREPALLDEMADRALPALVPRAEPERILPPDRAVVQRVAVDLVVPAALVRSLAHLGIL